VLVLVLMAVLTVVAFAGSMVGGLLVGQRRAASAADLAAIAAATALGPGASTSAGGSAACQAAGRVSEANRARLTGCLVEGQAVVVEVAVEVPGLVGRTWQVPGRARAGPATGAGGRGP
jgi:secretion/DNA translocation related TadE-like protein